MPDSSSSGSNSSSGRIFGGKCAAANCSAKPSGLWRNLHNVGDIEKMVSISRVYRRLLCTRIIKQKEGGKMSSIIFPNHTGNLSILTKFASSTESSEYSANIRLFNVNNRYIRPIKTDGDRI